MYILPKSAIKEIARQIEDGNTCYLQRFKGGITTFDNSTTDEKLIAKQEKLKIEIERKIDDYVILNQPNDEDLLEMMNEFLDDVSDKSDRKQLSNALKRKKPIRNFMQTVESEISMEIHWGNFKREAFQRWVSNVIIDAYNY